MFVDPIFAVHVRTFVIVFLDDILVYRLLDMIRPHQLFAKASNCTFT